MPQNQYVPGEGGSALVSSVFSCRLENYGGREETDGCCVRSTCLLADQAHRWPWVTLLGRKVGTLSCKNEELLN